MSPVDAVKAVFEGLTGQIVNVNSTCCHGTILWRAGLCPDKDNWSGLSAELQILSGQHSSLKIYWAQDPKTYPDVKYLIFQIGDGPEDTMQFRFMDHGMGRELLKPGHWSAGVCAEIILEYFRLVNGFPTQQPATSRDEQVRLELMPRCTQFTTPGLLGPEGQRAS